MSLMNSSVRDYPVILLVLVLTSLGYGCSSSSDNSQQLQTAFSGRSYSTAFPVTENPISEGGTWIGGQSAGGNLWGNVQAKGNMAIGVSEPTKYGDPTAVLTGAWRGDQMVSGKIRIVKTPSTCCHEVELRLRVIISAGRITGYEAYCSVVPGSPYCHIARWNGPNGSYCNIESSTPAIYAEDGDILMATAMGSNPTTITLYMNGKKILEAIDTGQWCSPGGRGGPFTSGNPGIGFYNDQDSDWTDFGFSTFSVREKSGVVN